MVTQNKGKIELTLLNGKKVIAFAPVIVSASRSTDIPAFYSDWFFQRLKEGYSVWINPFNGQESYVAYSKTRFIVFWSKNPSPLLNKLDYLKEMGIGCYVQYTLNDYEKEGLEKGIPPLSFRISTFKRLVDKLGKGHVIWRFDPMLLTENISINILLEKVRLIGNQLKGYTEKMVFSFADIASYRKVKVNLKRNNIKYIEWTEALMDEFADRLSVMNKECLWKFQLATCGEKINLEEYGIIRNKCIDDDLIIRLAYKDKVLMDHLQVDIHRRGETLFDDEPLNSINLDDKHYAIKQKNNKDKGQRPFCGCIDSKDIGQYNTCPHLCEYCYANTSKETAQANYSKHKSNPLRESII